MKKIYLAVILGMTMAQGFAQTGGMSDTVRTMSEVEVIGIMSKKNEAGKLNVPLHHLPVSISAVQSNVLDTRGIVNMQDAVKFLPNTRMRTTYGAYQQFAVRGYDYTPVMIDGVRDERTSITNSAPLGDLSNVESIELLKGPASVLYGHSAVGGIVNVTRKAPTDRTVVNALLSYGSWGNKRAMMDFGGKLAGPFNYRAVAGWSDNEGYRSTGDKRFSGYLAIGGKLGNNRELDIRGGFNRDWYGTEIGLPRFMANDVYNADGSKYLSKGEMLPGLDDRWRYNNESDFMKNHASNVSVKYVEKISEAFRLENRLAYNYDNIDYFSTEELSYPESDAPVYRHYYMRNDAKRYISLDSLQLSYPLRFAYTVHTVNEQLEASGRLEFDNGMKYNYLGGYNFVYFFRNTYRGYGGTNPETGAGYKLSELIFGPGLSAKVPVRDPRSMGYMDPHFNAGTATRNYTHGVYLHNLLELSDKLKVMLSGRFDHFIFKTATAKIYPISKERKYSELPEFDKTSTSAFTYRAGIVYLPAASLSAYGSFANFFMPHRDIVNLATTVYIAADGNRFYPKSGEEAFKPQTGYQAELGARYSLNSLLQATASVFYIRRNNEKKTLNSGYLDPDDEDKSKSVVGQVATSESKGFELELTLVPVRNASFSLGYGYTDAKVGKFSFGAEQLTEKGYMDANVDVQNGLPLAGVPKHTFFATGNYEAVEGVFKNLSFNLTFTYTDKVYRDLNKTVTYPAYCLTDLGASYKLKGGIRLRVNVNNVFNEKYFNQSLSTQMVPSLPRNYLFAIAYSL
jgi:outer membrane receptor protein involved in Fe transport